MRSFFRFSGTIFFGAIALLIVNANFGFLPSVSAAPALKDERLIAAVDLPFEDPTGFTPEAPGIEAGEGGSNAGSDQLVGTIRSIVTFLKYIAGSLALIWLVWSGVRMISAGDKEDEAKKAQTGVTYAVIALMLIVLVEPLITQTLFGGSNGIAPGDQLMRENISTAISAGKRQVIEVVEWVEAMVIFLGVAYLIFSCFKLLQDFGGEEEVSKQKQVILWMAVGFILIALDKVIIDQVFYGAMLPDDAIRVQFRQNPQRGISEIVGLLNYFLQFLGALSVGMMVYAGILMITSFGNEEGSEKGKKILTGAGIGFVIILSSYILANSLIRGRIF